MSNSPPKVPNAMRIEPAELTPEERFNRIAEAAYLRAAARGFAGGDPLQDWLDAEAELMKSAGGDPNSAESEHSQSTPLESKR